MSPAPGTSLVAIASHTSAASHGWARTRVDDDEIKELQN